MSLSPAQLQNAFLAGAGAIAGATSIILKSFKSIDGVNLAMSDFGSIGYLTMEPGNNTLEEQVSFTSLTQNSNGTCTLGGIKSVLFLTPYTATSGLSKTHAGSTTVVVTNTSGYYNEFTIKQNDEAVTGQWTFPNPPLANANPATKQYVDDLVSGGTITVSGLIVAGTAGETVAAGNFLYLKVSDGLWYKTDADSASTTDLLQIGIAQGSGTVNNPVTGGVMLQGIDTNQSGLAAGTLYYLSGTAGAISSSAGAVERAIGQGRTTTSIYFNPNFYYIPTANQKGAFVGTSGTPSSTNPYATKATTDLLPTIKFGGTGADGALSISSGTTNIDLSNAAVLIKNYTSISIIGTGALTFTNPSTSGTIVIFKSQGAVSLTSSAAPMIDLRLLGAAGGAGFSGANGNGTVGSKAVSTVGTCLGGTGGVSGTTVNAGGVGTNIVMTLAGMIASKQIPVFAGAGGGGGGTSTGSVGGAGGKGAGGIYIECGGALNFTTAGGISIAGAAGVAGSGGTNSGGGGGGASGSCVILYTTLTAASGTVTVTAGAGAGGSGTGGRGGGGGNMLSGVDSDTNNGGNGSTGLSLIAANTDFI